MRRGAGGAGRGGGPWSAGHRVWEVGARGCLGSANRKNNEGCRQWGEVTSFINRVSISNPSLSRTTRLHWVLWRLIYPGITRRPRIMHVQVSIRPPAPSPRSFRSQRRIFHSTAGRIVTPQRINIRMKHIGMSRSFSTQVR